MKTFSKRVVEAAISIPKGRVSTYGDIAKACGSGGQASRSITGILVRASKNGVDNIPFHRIIYGNGQVWKNGYCDEYRSKLYKKEGLVVNEKGYVVNFSSLRFEF